MKSCIRFITIFALIAIVAVLLQAPSFTLAKQHKGDPQAVPTSSTIHLFKSDIDGLAFELNTPPFFVAEDGSIQINGLNDKLVESGSPALPYYSAFIALPPNAEVVANVEQLGLTSHSSQYIMPAPQEQLWGEESDESDILAFSAGSIRELAPEFIENPSVYDLDAEYPGMTSLVSEPMYMRGMRLVEIKLYPLQYNPYRNTLTQASKLMVDVRFTGADHDYLRSTSSYSANQEAAWREKIINFDQANDWRHVPKNISTTEDIKLPIDTSVYKIELDQDGIYEVSGSELASLGMHLPADPAKIQMMQGGKSVAFQFIDMNSNQDFDAVDKIRFYGWAFDGSRQEKLFVTNNIFWLWVGNSTSNIPVIDNFSASGTTITSFRESITKWQERYFSSGWAITWNENDPTAWHNSRFNIDPGGTEHIESIDLPNPVPDADSVTYLVEFTTQIRRPLSGSSTTTFEVKTSLNNAPTTGNSAWTGQKNLNVINTVAGNVLKQPGSSGYPANEVTVKLSSNSATPVPIHITRITIDYSRQLKAVADQLIFRRDEGGLSNFAVSGFTNGDPDQALIWDVSNPHLPQQIKMQAENITGSEGDHTYLFGRNHEPNARFIVTTDDNVLEVKSLSNYQPVSIDPPSGGASWLAITHNSLKGAAEKLAAYRRLQMGAYVVNIEDVVNQIGYGFNTPETIRQYLRHAINDWTTAPDYVTLFGDATNNPRNMDCNDCGANWYKDTPTLIVTDFAFVDRWQGMMPSDFAMSLLFGDDLIPDIAISRMPANTNDEALFMVQKVINYETQRELSLQDWQRNFLFIADDADEGGNFCVENAATGKFVPAAFNQTHLCLVPQDSELGPTPEEINRLRADMREQISDIGTSIVNYRGHGSTNRWAGYNGEPPILSADDDDFWENLGRAVVILSADCLDGYFISNDKSALGETIFRLNNRGSVAHWSSAGLGYSTEHSILHKGFYEGMFKFGQINLGDAANFAKIEYYQSGRHISELHSFILLGDAAMIVVPDERRKAFLPIAITP
jgi:hypothetical protein